ncbi:MAG: hypothetical protein FD168_1438 [Desulfobulbaceae bacterium]|nr:MAG: hypothetical protein FD168_1438 [Desulfobulbaceae bacterium]
MRSVSIICPKEVAKAISGTFRGTEMLFFEKDPQLLCSILRKTVGSYCFVDYLNTTLLEDLMIYPAHAKTKILTADSWVARQ